LKRKGVDIYNELEKESDKKIEEKLRSSPSSKSEPSSKVGSRGAAIGAIAPLKPTK